MVWQLKTTPLTDEQYAKWSELLELRTGMTLLPHMRSHVQAQLGIRMRELECSDIEEYFKKVSNKLEGMGEWRLLIDRLMVKETSFFRHLSSYSLLQNYIRERYQQGLLSQHDSVSDISIDVWSVGCSTGEEPYSLAIALTECFKDLDITPYYSVTGTDISGPALKKAREGVYKKARLDNMDPLLVERYFQESGKGLMQVAEVLRKRTCFNKCNIQELARLPLVPMDVIYCQNVLIYFRRWRRREILDQLVTRLKPGGILIIAPGEITEWQNPNVRPLNKNNTQAYQRLPERPEGS